MKYKGYQVNPSEIENVIQSIEGVELVTVVGIPDPIATNLAAALIVIRPEFEDELTEQFIVDFVAEKLADYKQLHGGAHFVDELPMTPSGKIQKRFAKFIAIKEYNEKMVMKNEVDSFLESETHQH
jgi:4-coumarate--CoA ligase